MVMQHLNPPNNYYYVFMLCQMIDKDQMEGIKKSINTKKN